MAAQKILTESEISPATSAPRSISVPGGVLADRQLSGNAKLVHGALAYHQGKNLSCWPGVRCLAKEIGVSQKTVSLAIDHLVEAGLILRLRRYRRSNLYSVRLLSNQAWLVVEYDLLSQTDLSALEKLLIALLHYRSYRSEASETWPLQQDLAQQLGCSARSINRIVHDLKTRGYLQVKKRPGQASDYRLTCKASQFCAQILTYAKITSQKDKTSVENRVTRQTYLPFDRATMFEALSLNSGIAYGDKQFNLGASPRTPPAAAAGTTICGSAGLAQFACQILFAGTASTDSETTKERAFQALISQGIARKVARSIVYEQCHPLLSIQNAIANGIILQEHKQQKEQRLCTFRLPAYIVGTLNGARAEAKTVPPSTLFRRARARFNAQRRAAKWNSENAKSVAECTAEKEKLRRAWGLTA